MQDSDPPQDSQEHIDARNSQGFLYKPTGPVEQVFIEAEKAYDVRGLPNPYLGLRAFTYADRAAFAGREALVEESVARITNPGDPQSLTFITGASGSGKSSFAQAGLLPALEEHYRLRGKTTHWAVFRPGTNPLPALADAMLQLGLPEISGSALQAYTPQQFTDFLSEYTPADQVNLLVIDQFEENFTQAQPDQARCLIALLSQPPAFASARTHLIATLRSDYLDWLFEEEALWERATRFGVGLRAMDGRQLKTAILKPLQAAAQSDASLKGKQIEPALADRLAADASADAAYLPLLQVTLQDLWERGQLKLSEYSGLAEAISRRAERVYGFSDFEAAQLSQARSTADQEAILGIFLDLVSVSLDDDPRRDVRRWLLRHDFEKAAPDRPRLVEHLLHARLLNVQVESQGESEIERVSIIHEALITRWERLKEAVQASRDRLRRRARFELDLNEWQVRGGDLLSGARLADALALQRENDPVVGNEPARNFLALSQERFVAEQRKEVAGLRWERALRGLASGALAFGLLSLLTYQPQFDFSTNVLATLFVATTGALAGLIFTLGLHHGRDSRDGLAGIMLAVASGSIALAFPIIIRSWLVSSYLDLFIALEALIWGFIAGSSAYWAIRSPRPGWQRILIAAILSGLALMLGESIGHALIVPDRTGAALQDLGIVGLSPGLVFLGGALVQVILLLVTRLVVLSPAQDS
jgi:hypothetical protein